MQYWQKKICQSNWDVAWINIAFARKLDSSAETSARTLTAREVNDATTDITRYHLKVDH
jgi:hypothetical protein